MKYIVLSLIPYRVDENDYFPSVCSIGIDTEEGEKHDRRQEREYLQRRKRYDPNFILLQRDSPKLSTLLKPNYDVNLALLAQTEEVVQVFSTCYLLTMENLYREMNGYWYDRPRRIPIEIDHVVRLLQKELGLPVPQDITGIDHLNHYFKSICVSWFNFEPIALISNLFLNPFYPELQKKWMEYYHLFHEYCYQRNLKDCKGILFNTENDNIFILRVDETYYTMTLPDISSLRDSLCYVLGCNKLSVHPLSVLPGSLLLVFCYCADDYHSRFQQLTKEQLTCLADLKICKVLSLRDIENRFVYSNIQNTVCLYFDVSGHIIIITFLFLRLHHI